MKEGISHRHYGLYKNLSQIFLNLGALVFWYDCGRKVLVSIDSSSEGTDADTFEINSLHAFYTTVKKCLLNRTIPIIIVNYPHSFLGIQHLPEYVLFLLLLRIFVYVKKIFVVIDNIDPPIEHQKFYGIKGVKSVLVKCLWSFLELLALKNNKLILLTESWKRYYLGKYGIRPQDVIVVPCGSFSEGFQRFEGAKPKSTSNSFIVFYAGVATKRKNVDKLVKVIDELSDEGLDVKLTITGPDMIGIRSENVRKICAPRFEDFARQIVRSDVAIIPYTAFYSSLTSLAKVGDYMMGSKPLISTPLIETSRLIEEARCGYVVRDFKELKNALENLYNNRTLVAELGRRAREYAEKNLDYAVLSARLFNKITSMIDKNLLREM